MRHRLTCRSQFRAVAPLALAVALAACGGDDKEEGTNMGTDGGGGTAAGNSINAAALRACPQATTLIETTEWMSCLEGKRITGTEPFNNQSCELRIGANGTFEYLRGGTVVLGIPARSTWRGANGTYQNTTSGGGTGRLFLASITPDLAPVDGQAWITSINLSFFEVLDDTIEVKYMDAARNRQTYNCKVNGL